MDEAKFSIGKIEYPRDDDEQFDSQEDAEVAAIHQSSYNDQVMAVWDNDGGAVLAIAYCGTLYTP